MKVDMELKKTVLDLLVGDENLSYCYQCGKCDDVCPIHQRWGSRYSPRDIVMLAVQGYKETIVEAIKRDPFYLWGCTTCETCDEECPEHIPITDIICELKNMAVKMNITPPFYIDSSRTIMNTGMSIPLQSAIAKRRKQLGVGDAPAVPSDEVEKIIKATGFGTILEKDSSK